MTVPVTSTQTLSDQFPVPRDRVAALDAMGREERLARYRAGGFSFDDCCLWARRFKDEVPLLDGEFEFHMRWAPEVCE